MRGGSDGFVALGYAASRVSSPTFSKKAAPYTKKSGKPAAYSRHEDVWHWGSNPSLLYQAFVCATKYTMHPCRQDLSDSLYMLQAIHHVKDGT